MTLTNLTDFPPGGYKYREPSLNWEAPPDLALQGLNFVVAALSTVRSQNPASGLDPSYAACEDAIKAYQCARFAHNPEALYRWCSDAPMPARVRDASRPVTGGCRSCGGRR